MAGSTRVVLDWAVAQYAFKEQAKEVKKYVQEQLPKIEVDSDGTLAKLSNLKVQAGS